MKILNVGVLEVAFIILLALIVLGPEKAVKAAGDLGKWVRKVTRSSFWQDIVAASRQIQDLPKKVMDDAEIQRTMEDIERSTGSIDSKLRPKENDWRADIDTQSDDVKLQPTHPPPEESNNKA